MWTRLPLLCSFVAAAWAQTNDPKDLLLRVRANVTGTVHRLPKYMRSLTIERTQYRPDPKHATSCDGMAAQRTKGQLQPRLYETDRVRLDVGIAAANEIYSWVGEDRFDNRDLFNLVREGALQSGGFSGFLTSIFYLRQRRRQFHLQWRDPVGGTDAARIRVSNSARAKPL